MEIWADLHTHTRFSHGRGRIEDNVKAAVKRGLKALAITDHGPAVLWVGMPVVKKLDEIRREVERCNKLYQEIELLLGIEANIVGTDGELDVPPEVIKELDFLVIGLHPWVFTRGLRSGLYLSFFNTITRMGLFPPVLSRGVNTMALVNAVKRYPVDMISHPGSFFSVDMVSLAGVCRARGTLLELNNYHASGSYGNLRAAVEEGACFAINSDAHRPSEVGAFKNSVKTAGLIGIGEDRIFNAGYPDDQKLEWLKHRRKNKELSKRVLPGKIMIH